MPQPQSLAPLRNALLRTISELGGLLGQHPVLGYEVIDTADSSTDRMALTSLAGAIAGAVDPLLDEIARRGCPDIEVWRFGHLVSEGLVPLYVELLQDQDIVRCVPYAP